MKLSNQAVGSIMMALQKAILKQIDVTAILKGMRFSDSVDGLLVENPPIFEIKKDPQDEETTSA